MLQLGILILLNVVKSQQMAQLGLLGMEIFGVVLVLRHLNRHAFYDLKTVAFETFDFARIIRHQLDLADTQIFKNLCSDPVVAQIRRESQLQIGVYGV
ncbi:hypothetical protein D3C71_1965240 [compost metagenome]